MIHERQKNSAVCPRTFSWLYSGKLGHIGWISSLQKWVKMTLFTSNMLTSQLCRSCSLRVSFNLPTPSCLHYSLWRIRGVDNNLKQAIQKWGLGRELCWAFSHWRQTDDFSSHGPLRAWPEGFEFWKVFDATCTLEGLACNGVQPLEFGIFFMMSTSTRKLQIALPRRLSYTRV